VDSKLKVIRDGIRRHGRRPLLFVLAVAVLSAGVTMLLPKRYRAQASLLPPQESAESFGIIAGLIEASALSRVGLITATSTSDVFVEILGSRRVREAVVKRFDLMNRYGEENLDECLQRFDENVTASASRSKIVRIEVEDRNPEMAARICNALVEELDKVNREVRTSRATQQRSYLTEQLGQVEARLREAEDALARYERSHGVVLGGSEAAAVEGVADLLSRKLALQVRKSWMESYAQRDNPGLTAVTSELQAVDRELSRLPGLKQQGDRMALDVEIQRRVFTLLTAQLEEAKLEENRTMTALAVLDPARAPTRRSKPRRGFIVLVSTSVALVLAGAWVAWRTRDDLARARGDLGS
jgi:uncharacterized protein involved in exopolysaccharide biosynthesis